MDWNQFFDYFWRQVSPENVRDQLNKKKIAKLDEIGIGSGRDYKAWLICLFTVFTKNVCGKETDLNYIQPQT